MVVTSLVEARGVMQQCRFCLSRGPNIGMRKEALGVLDLGLSVKRVLVLVVRRRQHYLVVGAVLLRQLVDLVDQLRVAGRRRANQ